MIVILYSDHVDVVDGKLNGKEMVYLPASKYVLFFVEHATVNLRSFATEWSAHEKPLRLRSSSDRTITLAWVSFSDLVHALRSRAATVTTSDKKRVGLSGMVTDTLDPVIVHFQETFGMAYWVRLVG